jgi:hypothetical protein
MPSRAKAGELIVPGLVLLGCLLYWIHIQDARSVAQRVPLGVIVLTVGMTLLVLAKTFLGPARDGEADGALALSADRRSLIQRTVFIGLCGGYFVAIGALGFNLANLAFLLLAYPLAGLGLVWAGCAAVISTVIFHFLARIMEFNVPTGPFGF